MRAFTLAVVVFSSAASLASPAIADEDAEACAVVNLQAVSDAQALAPTPDVFRPPSLPRLFVQDVAHVFTGPLHWRTKDWTFLGVSLVGLGAMSFADKSITNELAAQGNSKTFADGVADVFEPIGAAGALGVMAAFYGGGLAWHDSKAKDAAFDMLAASLISGGIAEALKAVVGRGRPSEHNGSFQFQPLGGRASFPSGHTTEAFTLAAVISSTYEKPGITIAAYGSAGLVGFARIRHSAHFATDVAAGALIGTATGLSVVHFNKRQRSAPENTPERIISAGPSLDGRGTVISAGLRF